MAKLKKEEIAALVKEMASDAEGYDQDALSQMRKDALSYYYNDDDAAPSVAGRSKIQSSDVADMIEALVAQIMPAFALDNVCEFTPLSEADVNQARAETSAVNYVVMQQNRGAYEIQQAVRDALLLRNGIIKVYLEEKQDTETQVMRALTELEYGQLMRGNNPELETRDSGYRVETLEPTVPGMYDVSVVRKWTDRMIRVKAVDPVCFSWERDHNSIFLQRCRYVCEQSYVTRSELIERGYKKSQVNALPAATGYSDSAQARSRGTTRQSTGVTPASDLIDFREVYCRIDIDGDGIAELNKVCMVEDTVLEYGPVDYVPYASGTPFIQPHRFNGLGLYDKLRYVQDQKTFGIRQWADNLNNANNSRLGVVEGQVNIEDVTNARPGGVIRMRSPDSIVPIPVVDVGPSAQQFLDYADKVRSERGGASLDLQSAQMQIAGDTAHGIERQMTSKELLAAMVTQTLADTMVRTVYELVHTALRLYVPDPFGFRVAGQFVNVDPSTWQERKEISVKAGLSMAERMRKSAALQTVIGRQDYLVSVGMGGVMVSNEGIFNASRDWSIAQGLDHPESYLLDPHSEQSQQASQAKAEQEKQAQAKAEQAQQQLLAMQAEVESRKANNEDAKVIEDGRQFDAEMAFKYWQEGQQAEAREAELAITLATTMLGSEAPEAEDEEDAEAA